MSDVALSPGGNAPGTFRGLTVALMLLLGLIGFSGVLLLGAYAPDLQSGRNGGTHALSNAAVGFSGLYRLADATGRHPRIVRSNHDYGSEDLLIISPEHGWIELGEPLGVRHGKPTLLIMPKWSTRPDEKRSGWVTADGFVSPGDPGRLLSPGIEFTIARRLSHRATLVSAPEIGRIAHFASPHQLQVITGMTMPKGSAVQTLHPLVGDGAGGIVIGQLGPGPLYIIADPDLFSNIGMADPRQAKAALALLDWLNSSGAESIGFDVTSNGLGQSRSPLKLAFDPPFLSTTLILLVVMGLLGWYALGRFGPVRRRARTIAFGKRSLVDNSAAIIKRAGRETRVGHRYVQVIRERAVTDFAIPSRIRDEALDAYLDRIGRGAAFTDLAQAVEQAGDKASLTEAARALHDWHKEKMGAG